MGVFEEAKGKVKEAVGDLTDNPDLQREGEAQARRASRDVETDERHPMAGVHAELVGQRRRVVDPLGPAGGRPSQLEGDGTALVADDEPAVGGGRLLDVGQPNADPLVAAEEELVGLEHRLPDDRASADVHGTPNLLAHDRESARRPSHRPAFSRPATGASRPSAA